MKTKSRSRDELSSGAMCGGVERARPREVWLTKGSDEEDYADQFLKRLFILIFQLGDSVVSELQIVFKTCYVLLGQPLFAD